MKQKISIAALIAILLISGFIYFYRLNQIPNGFYVDEATISYNAFSILTTGKDEYGKSFPVLFRLLGSYTPPLFIYLSVPFIYFFGLDPSVFRSISAISALLSILFLYIFSKKLNLFKYSYTYHILAFFYAISPWLVFNSRLGYEVMFGFTIFNIGLYFLYLAIERSNNLIWGLSILSISTYVSHTQRYLLPVFLPFYLIVFARDIFKKKNTKQVFLAILALLIIQIPNFSVISTQAFWVKNARLIDQPAKEVISNILNQTFLYLSPKSLFYEVPDIDMQHTIPEISVMYNWMIIPYLIGFFFLFTKIKAKSYKFIATLFITSLVPAILSGEFISIQRALPFLLPLIIVIGLGLDFLWSKLPRRFAILTFILLSFYSLILLYRSYFVLFPKERANAWNYGYSEITDLIKQSGKVNFVVDNSRNPRNYILLLYFLRYPPETYQKEVNPIYKSNYYQSLPPENTYKFSNIEIRAIEWETDVYKDQIIIGDSLSVSENQAREHFLEKIYKIKDPLQNTIFIAYKTNPIEKCKVSFNTFYCAE